MTARMLAVDLRRGPAPILGLAVLGLGGALALGGGCDAVLSLRRAMWLVFPCVLAAGVWHGGSARRRHVDEAITASALPAERRSAVEGGSITVAGFAAFVLLFGAQTLSGGCTALTAGSAAAGVVAFLALAAAAFAGLALGRIAAAPMAAPLVLFAGLVVTSLFGGWSVASADTLLLLPSVAEGGATDQLSVKLSVAQTLWFAGLAVSGWLCASRPRLTGLAPAAAGLVALWALV